MSESPIIDTQPLGFQWQTADPFLFCVHHEDFYPRGNGRMGPASSLQGRNLGQDFEGLDGWRMYHGQQVPGFPGHPHRGFETVTIVRKGMVDHADSLGAAARYGEGDVQWLTTGRGLQHSEMFPLLHEARENPMELFQIWLNLPPDNKLVEPHFAIFWHEQMPVLRSQDAAGHGIEVELVAGQLEGVQAPSPPPYSWAAQPDNQVAIWLISLDANAHWTLPSAAAGLNRQLFFFEGERLSLAGQNVQPRQGIRLRSEQAVELHNGTQPASLLLLQGKPIGAPVAQHGPFVMNTREQLQQAFADYQRDQFGGWPWPRQEQTFEAGTDRFARHADGREEQP